MNPEKLILELLYDYGIEEGCRKFCLEKNLDSETMIISSIPESENSNAGFQEELKAWALLEEAFLAIRNRSYDNAFLKLESSKDKSRSLKSASPFLDAGIAHYKGTLFHHIGDSEKAIHFLNLSLELYSRNHFCSSRVLDTLGMVYSSRNNYLAAREFFEQALNLKALQKPPDKPGIALTHGQLGRLFLEWGNFDKAEYHFKEDLTLSVELNDIRSIAIVSNQLARVKLTQGDFGAAENLNLKSYKLSKDNGWPITTFFACKEFILINIALEKQEESTLYLKEATEIINKTSFTEGRAFLLFARGMMEQASNLLDDADKSLREALELFDSCSNRLDAARTQLEIARVSQKNNHSVSFVLEELTKALDRAEKTRRYYLVKEVEEEIKRIDMSHYCLCAYRRARGRRISEDTVSLVTGKEENVTIIFLDIQRFTDFSRSQEPETVFMTLNQIFYDLGEIFERYEITVNQYLGDGFMAIVRGNEHPLRAVKASLEIMKTIEEFNIPRKVLELPLLKTRIGINTGPVYLGNVGTYTKIDFTGIGTTTNQAARFQSEAFAGIPCLSKNTFEAVKEHFTFRDDNPRLLNLKGLGEKEAWDVTGSR